MTLRLAKAALADTTTLALQLARVVVIDPCLCRFLGHHWHVWIAPQPYLVCDRCGRIEDAR